MTETERLAALETDLAHANVVIDQLVTTVGRQSTTIRRVNEAIEGIQSALRHQYNALVTNTSDVERLRDDHRTLLRLVGEGFERVNRELGLDPFTCSECGSEDCRCLTLAGA